MNQLTAQILLYISISRNRMQFLFEKTRILDMNPLGSLIIIQNFDVKARLNRKPGSENYQAENPLKYSHNFLCYWSK